MRECSTQNSVYNTLLISRQVEFILCKYLPQNSSLILYLQEQNVFITDQKGGEKIQTTTTTRVYPFRPQQLDDPLPIKIIHQSLYRLWKAE